MSNNYRYRYKRYVDQDQETRWATREEIQNAASYVNLREDVYPAAGLPILSNGAEAYVDNSDTHSLIYGATGSKKTRLFCMPMLNFFIRAGESFVTTDPKGELYQRTSGMASEYGYDIVVLNFRDLGKGDLWNPLSLPYEYYHNGKKEKAAALLNDFVQVLATPQFMNTKDVFWPEMASAFALANLMLIMECGTEEEANVVSLSRLCSGDVEDKLRVLSKRMSPYTIAGMNYKNVLTAGEKTRQSIYASLYAMIRVFNVQQDLCRILSRTTFDMRMFGRRKTAVYIIVPDEKTTLHFLVTTFIKQVYEIQIAEAQKEKTGKLPVRLNFVLDEFCNIPKIPEMPSMISAARSRDMRFYLVVQSLHQLKGRYGEDADTIKGNCENIVFLTSKELDLLGEISALCGRIITAGGRERNLISVSELQRLNKERGEALIMHAREYPTISELADIDEYRMFQGYPAVPMQDQQNLEYRIFSMDDYFECIINGEKDVPFEKV